MDIEKIHIGKMVEAAFNQSGMTKSDFSRKIGIYNQNLNRLFENEDWSVIKLIEAGRALNYDFSPLFKIGDSEKYTPKVMLQIEIEDEKINEVLKVIQDKKLYNIIKR